MLNYIRQNINNQLEGIPGYHQSKLLYLYQYYKVENISPIWVSPDDIVNLTGSIELREEGHLDYTPYFKPREANWNSIPYEREVRYGEVLNGNWDLKRADFSNLLMYRGTHQRYVEGAQWEETIFYKRLSDHFYKQGWTQSESGELAIERCKQIEAVYDRLDSEGYRSQKELNGHPLHEVTVNVSRDGELLYNCEGRHRLCVAKILGLESIPVIILARHTNFNESIDSIDSQ